ncbi:MAG: hypothetical protein RIC56_13735 [Pseudomonadales bacterium]
MIARRALWPIGIVSGVSIAGVVTLIVTVWEWLENPSGIFHDADGTRWSFVFDTALSWFVPTFLWAGGIAALAYAVAALLRRRRRSG